MATQPAVDDAAATLREAGVVAVEGYLDPETCDEWRRAIDDVLADLPRASPDEGYGDLAGREEAVVKQRSGDWDAGMLDVFNIEAAVPATAAFKSDAYVASVVNEATDPDIEYVAENLNVYVNRSVTETRDFHADTFSGKFKSFVYLTDVPDESYGPFAYVPGSHDHGAVERRTTQLVNTVTGNPETDAVFADSADARVFTAPRGTLIVANQAGYHRGMPQREGRDRMLATTSYTPA
jgi:hypothetical protein